MNETCNDLIRNVCASPGKFTCRLLFRGLGLGMLLAEGFSPLMAPQAILSTLDGFILLAVPLFLLMSNVLLYGGCGKDLYSAVQAWVGHWPGGLAIATIVSCGIFAAISGVSVATAATIGVVAIPEMISRGYNKNFVYGLLAAGGTLGILIPPSLPMIVYGFITEESVISLFLAGIGPGIFLIGLFILYSIIYAHVFGGYTPTEKASWDERLRHSIKSSTNNCTCSTYFGRYLLWYFHAYRSRCCRFCLINDIDRGNHAFAKYGKFQESNI